MTKVISCRVLTRGEKFLLTLFAQQKVLSAGALVLLPFCSPRDDDATFSAGERSLPRVDGAGHGTFSCCGGGKNFFGPPKTVLNELSIHSSNAQS